MNITQYKLHNISMRTLPLSAVCIERLNALQPKQSCWSEGYLKPKPRTYCHLPDVCLLCVLWSLSLSLQSVPVALFVSEEELMFWCSLVGADRPPCSFRTGRFGVWCPLLGAESDSCGENNRWKGPTSRKVRVHFGKSGYSSREKQTWQGIPRRFSDTAGGKWAWTNQLYRFTL